MKRLYLILTKSEACGLGCKKSVPLVAEVQGSKVFEGKKCLFSTYSYMFRKGNLQFILVVVRGSKNIFCSPSCGAYRGGAYQKSVYPRYFLRSKVKSAIRI